MQPEKPTNRIDTAGQLRRFLADMLVGVKNGHVAPEKASQITKMAAQINESLYAEIKATRVLSDLKKQVPEFGDLPIGEKDA